MRVLVFGAGAIGSLLGHRLASAGHEVTLVARREYVDVVRAQGLGRCCGDHVQAGVGPSRRPPGARVRWNTGPPSSPMVSRVV